MTDRRESLDGMTLDDPADATQVPVWASEDNIRASYDVVAETYATEIADDMVARPLERGIMLSFIELVRALGDGVVGDVGCGPGQFTKHLAANAVRAIGIDISPAMIRQARAKFPTGDFRVGSMFDLPVLTGAWTGAIAIYATLHSPADDRARLFRELWRVVRPGGYVLHGFYVSAPDHPSGTHYHLDEWFGHRVDLDAYFVSIDDAATELDRGGFDVMAALSREPLSTNELPARRCYMLGKRR